jgi:hypothetical protein
MKTLFIALAVGILVLGASLGAGTALAGFSFEDPQACLNGQLLSVVPSTESESWLYVGDDVEVDLGVESCGGQAELAFHGDHVLTGAKKADGFEVQVQSVPGASVTVTYAGKVQVKDVNGKGWAMFKLKAK